MQGSSAGLPPPAARQPFTWRGLAALASRPAGWFFAWCLITVAVGGSAAGRFFATAWQPALDAAVRQLPASGEIHDGRLVWPTPAVTELARTRHLALRVNPHAAPVPGQSADVEIEFLSGDFSAQSLLGYWVVGYPRGWVIALNRPEIEPLWLAWRPHLPVLVGVGAGLGAWGLWLLAGLVAAPLLRLEAAVLRRNITLRGCWRLGVAACLPAGWIAAGGLLLYAQQGFRLLDWLIALALGLGVGLLLMLGAVGFLPRRPPRTVFAPATNATPPSPSPFARPPPAAPPAIPFAAPPGPDSPASSPAPKALSDADRLRPPPPSEPPESPLNPS